MRTRAFGPQQSAHLPGSNRRREKPPRLGLLPLHPPRNPHTLPIPMNRRLATLAIAALFALGLPTCASNGLLSASGPPLHARREPALEGGLVEFPKPGRVTLVDFWSTSCEPCKAMMPSLQALWVERKGAGLDVVGVASDDNPGVVSQQVQALGVSYPQVVDADGKLRGSFRVGPVPHSLVIDRQGRVRLSLQGGKAEDLEKIVGAVKAVLEEQR